MKIIEYIDYNYQIVSIDFHKDYPFFICTTDKNIYCYTIKHRRIQKKWVFHDKYLMSDEDTILQDDRIFKGTTFCLENLYILDSNNLLLHSTQTSNFYVKFPKMNLTIENNQQELLQDLINPIQQEINLGIRTFDDEFAILELEKLDNDWYTRPDIKMGKICKIKGCNLPTSLFVNSCGDFIVLGHELCYTAVIQLYFKKFSKLIDHVANPIIPVWSKADSIFPQILAISILQLSVEDIESSNYIFPNQDVNNEEMAEGYKEFKDMLNFLSINLRAMLGSFSRDDRLLKLNDSTPFVNKIIKSYNTYIEYETQSQNKFRYQHIDFDYLFCNFEDDKSNPFDPDMLIIEINTNHIHTIIDKNLHDIIKIQKLSSNIYAMLPKNSKYIHLFNTITMSKFSKVALNYEIKDFVDIDNHTMAIYANQTIHIYDWKHDYLYSKIQGGIEIRNFNQFLGGCNAIIYFTFFEEFQIWETWNNRMGIQYKLHFACIHNPKAELNNHKKIETLKKDVIMHPNLFKKIDGTKEFYYIDLKEYHKVKVLKAYSDFRLLKYKIINEVLKKSNMNNKQLINDILTFLP